jgi:hypothetical protein
MSHRMRVGEFEMIALNDGINRLATLNMLV